MLFNLIIKKIAIKTILISSQSKENISEIILSSRSAALNTIFTAIKGFKTDGHYYIEDAYRRGCRNFLIEDKERVNPGLLKDSTVVQVEDSREAFALLSNLIYHFPFNQLKMIGITGTKGKTTVTTILYHLLNEQFRCSMFSTIKNIIGDQEKTAVRTTMEANELQKMLRQSVNHQDQISVVEVSSHAVTLKRISGIQWDVGIFTSFSRDHLDLYQTMERYFSAKLDFFRQLNQSEKKNKLVIINVDDPKGKAVCQVIDQSVRLVTVGHINKEADYQIEQHFYENNLTYITIRHNHKQFHLATALRGLFNVYNIALAFACAFELKVDIDTIKRVLPGLKSIDGRFEIILNQPFTVIVDYAHSPDSLRKILIEARKICQKQIILVFGCTGDRDKDKRSIMGEIAAEYADFSVITNDDTYSEDPLSIAQQIEPGFEVKQKKIEQDYFILLDRKKAIRYAIERARPGDLLLLAGMGHEKVQILNGQTVAHNDKEQALICLKEKKIIN